MRHQRPIGAHGFRVSAVLVLAATLSFLAGVARGQAAAGQEGCQVPVEALAVGRDWSRVLAPDGGFVLDVPPGTSLHAGEGTWYVMLHDAEGIPRMPGMKLRVMPGRTLRQALDALQLPPDARSSPVALGPGTRGACVSATYEMEGGVRSLSHLYLAEREDGVVVLRLWEGMAWQPFDAVARSFTHVRPARPWPPEDDAAQR